MSVGSIDALTGQRQTADAQSPSATQGPSATEVAAARKVAQQFEAIFLRKLMSGLEKSGSLGGSSTGSQVYGSMMVGALADSASKSGGLGLADLVMKSLVPHMTAAASGAHAAAPSSAAVSRSSAVPGAGVLPSHLAKAPPLALPSTPAAPLAATPPYRIGAATIGAGAGSGAGSAAAVSPSQNAPVFDDPMGGVVP